MAAKGYIRILFYLSILLWISLGGVQRPLPKTKTTNRGHYSLHYFAWNYTWEMNGQRDIKDQNTNNKFYRSDYVYNAAAKGWIKYHRVPASWHDARLQCKYEGAVLASPINKGIFDAMTEILGNSSYLETKVMFIGVHATFAKGVFASVEGIPLSDMRFLQFASVCHKFVNTINDIQYCQKDCLIMGAGGGVHTSDCKLMLPYTCYKEDSLGVQISICGPNTGYAYEVTTNSCYKVHTAGRTWSRGYMTCAGEGGHLAIINSDVEMQVIKELLKKHPENTILADYAHVASIGASDWGERGSWWTIHGDTLEEAGYASWEGGKPDSKVQYCVGVNRSGKLNDIWCNNYTFPLICEKKPINLSHLISEDLQ